MKPDVLFWFYKDFDICRERLINLRKLNNDVRIFALYGGASTYISEAESLRDFVDDFYVYPHEKEPHWKWKNGDKLIVSWFKDRGQHLDWDTIFIMQWDMLILDPLERLFSGLKKNEILLSGHRAVSEVEAWWPWVEESNEEFSSFKSFIKQTYDYDDELYACLFIVACLPRIFLSQYADISDQETGFLEYKIPTMAHVFGIPVCEEHVFKPWWAADPTTRNVPMREKTLNAVGLEVPQSVIAREMAKSTGIRLFHPVSKSVPVLIKYNKFMIYIFSCYLSVREGLLSKRNKYSN